MIVCRKCNIEKEIECMVKSKKSKSGYLTICKECNSLISMKNREKEKDEEKEIRKKLSKIYRENNKEILKIYREKNKDKLRQQKSKWREENKDRLKQQKKEYRKNKKETDPIYKLSQLVSAIIRKSFNYNGFKKNSRTMEILSISFEEFKLYLESKFEYWMTWENRGLYNGEFNYGWDIDHIIPLSSARTEEDIIKLNHYTNLQPLCSKINRDIKKDKLKY